MILSALLKIARVTIELNWRQSSWDLPPWNRRCFELARILKQFLNDFLLKRNHKSNYANTFFLRQKDLEIVIKSPPRQIAWVKGPLEL